MIKKAVKVLARIFRNFSFFIHHDICGEISKVNMVDNKSKEILSSIISLYQKNISPIDDEYSRMALSFVRETGFVNLVPYHMKKIVQTIDCGLFDGFPYVIHKEKRLFFPDCWSLAKVKSFYSNYIENERIVNTDSGIGPHQYQAPDFIIEKDDILVDVGCAESLLALDVIETIKYAYLIENDPIWAKPLELTFKPFADKVKIVTKTISNKDSGDEITLPTLLMNEPSDTKVFIKMDIEGGEMSLLEAAKEYLENQDNIKVACCTYHRIEDAANIESLLESSGYSCSFSTGYILTSFLDPCGIPSLRKGIIRALKKKD